MNSIDQTPKRIVNYLASSPVKSEILSFRNLSLVCLTVCLAGCSSLDSSVRESVSKGEYRMALAHLEAKKAGAVPAPGLKPEVVKARDSFQSAVEKKFGTDAKQLYSEGKPRAGVAILEEATGLCAWSVALQQQLRDYHDCVIVLESLHGAWNGKSEILKDSVSEARGFIRSCEPVRDLLKDSPTLQLLLEDSEACVIRAASERIASMNFGTPMNELEKISLELQKLGTLTSVSNNLALSLRAIIELPAQLTPTNELPPEISRLTDTYRDVRKHEDAATAKDVGKLWQTIAGKTTNWAQYVLGRALERPSCSLSYLHLGESLVTELPQNSRALLNASIAAAYLNRAAAWAGTGVESALSLIFLEHYRELGGTNLARAEELRSTAASAFGNALPLQSQLSIKVDPKVEPSVTASIFWWAYSELVTRTKNWHEWSFSNEGKQQNALTLEVREADLIVEGLKQLQTVRSSYLSHFETVPNPEKAYLSSQIDSARIYLNFTESSYNSAVSSHNIYPTTYSLANVNNQKNFYYLALDRYNALVNSYNWTPATISKAVHLPYTFKEGDFRFGWSLEVSHRVNGNSHNVHGDSLVSDHVRLGTKITDVNVEYRRDDPLEIDFSSEASMAHLTRAFKTVYSDLNRRLLGFRYSSRKELEAEEQELLSWILHPWGPQESLLDATAIAAWVRRVDLSSILTFKTPEPPTVVIKQVTRTNENLSTEELVKRCQTFVCQILSESIGGEASGSGVLIGPDGLILTCAHVVIGRTPRIKLYEGERAGTYDVDVVYINTKRDVALLRAKQLNVKEWAPLRLENTVQRGEELVAIGNPALPTGDINALGISRGIVSNPEVILGDEPYLVADINIASGSSGGPVFSGKDGAVVGIVLAVAGPQINKEGVSTSGFTCLAAPGNRLKSWLGLRSER